jgi:polysaccharide biosynthesis/export protein
LTACLRTLTCVLLASLLAGCQSTLKPAVPVGQAAYDAILPPGQSLDVTYALSPGDEVSIAVYGEKELSQERAAVDGAGNLNLPLIGQITANGLTVSEVSAAIEDAYRRQFIRDPRVTVSLLKASGGMVTVEGEVKDPDVYPVRPGYTLLSAMALAGSPLPTARVDHVIIFRKLREGRAGGRFDLKAIRSGKVDDPPIRDGDVIVVGFSRKAGLYQDLLKLTPLLNTFVLLDNGRN